MNKNERILYLKIAKFQSKYSLSYYYSIRRLIKDLGIKLIRYGGYNIKDMLEVSEDGFSAVRSDGFYIFYNPDKAETRLNFTLAHELGHLTLSHHKLLNSKIIAHGGNSIIERQANIFAHNLLMPINRVEDYLKIKTTHEIAEIFEVSPAMVSTRLKYLRYDMYCFEKLSKGEY